VSVLGAAACSVAGSIGASEATSGDSGVAGAASGLAGASAEGGEAASAAELSPDPAAGSGVVGMGLTGGWEAICGLAIGVGGAMTVDNGLEVVGMAAF